MQRPSPFFLFSARIARQFLRKIDNETTRMRFGASERRLNLPTNRTHIQSRKFARLTTPSDVYGCFQRYLFCIGTPLPVVSRISRCASDEFIGPESSDEGPSVSSDSKASVLGNLILNPKSHEHKLSNRTNAIPKRSEALIILCKNWRVLCGSGADAPQQLQRVAQPSAHAVLQKVMQRKSHFATESS